MTKGKNLYHRIKSKKYLQMSIVTALVLVLLAQPVMAMPFNPSYYNNWNTVQVTHTPTPSSNLAATISSNGAKIAYALKNGDAGGSQFVILDTTTTPMTTTNLTSLAAGDFDPYIPTISADGSKVAFQSVDYGTSGSVIVLVNSDGSGKTVFGDRTQYNSANPSMSGDGSKIAFNANVPGRNEIYIINVNTGAISSLTPNVGSYSALTNCRLPAISGDGSKIVFYSFTSTNTADLYVINSDGTSTTPLKIMSDINTGPPLYVYPLSISQDGNKVVFQSFVSGNSQVFVWNANTGISQLTSGTSNVYPAISGDGSKIAFQTNRDDLTNSAAGQIYIMNADGSGLTRVTSTIDVKAYEPSIDYTGDKIAFHGSPNNHDSQIYLSTVDKEWGMGLTSSVSGYSDVTRIGVQFSATTGFDTALDVINPPQSPVGVDGYISCPTNPIAPVDLTKLKTSIVPPQQDINYTYKIDTIGTNGPLTISWNSQEVSTLPQQYGAFLLDPSGNTLANMRNVNSYSFAAATDQSYSFTVRVVIQATLTLSLSTGWNMVSFSVIPTAGTSFVNIFSGISGAQVKTWTGTSYTTPTDVEIGRGYWVLVLAPTTLSIIGIPVTSYSLDLSTGWSMIGSVNQGTITDALVFPGFYQSLTWTDNSYVSATTIEPGVGYWVVVLAPTHIEVG